MPDNFRVAEDLRYTHRGREKRRGGGITGIMNKAEIIPTKVYLLASRQINSPTLLWA